jgi:outer membrane protein
LSNRLIPTTLVEVTTGDYLKTGTTRTPVYQEVQNYKAEKVGYGTQMDNNLGYFAGVNLQIPIFNGFQTKNRVKQANINLQNVKLDAANTNYQLQQNIQQAWLNMQATFKRLELLKQQAQHFEESFKAAEVRFANGAINANEFLLVKNNLDRTKINMVQAKYEYTFRTKLLDFYQGKAL